MAKKKFIPVKSDIVFHMFFTDRKSEESLIAFLKAILVLPDDDYEIELMDPHLTREFSEDKLGIIDIKLKTKSGKTIQIEMQQKITPKFINRAIFYQAKLVIEQIRSGDDYKVINKTISILITDESLVAGSPRYHHCFRYYDREAGVELTDLIEIHTLELPKLPDNTDGTDLYNWARFIAAESEEDMDMAAESSPQLKQAVVRYRELTADEKTRELYERREKARHDYVSDMNWAREEGEQKGLVEGKAEGERAKALTIARNLLSTNLSVDEITTATGLTYKEIEDLRVLR